ncbi:MAG: AmmeMemoRadiSam system protein B [Chloroherpetonaceae bacterium]|nr:AmmeMemoRadiSam system protein B [Chloroherpetonaceae bacterium]
MSMQNSSLAMPFETASPMFNAPISKTSRPAVFAGDLYPADPVVLTSQIDAALEVAAKDTPSKPQGKVRVMIMPYGPFQHSLSVLAKGYQRLSGERYDTVVLISPSVNPFNKLAISGYGFFDTPLGKVEINDFIRNEYCDEDDDFFISEDGVPKGSSIEIQLPFLIRTIGQQSPFTIVPILVGNQSIDLCNETASVTSEILQGRNALVIAINNFFTPNANHPEIEQAVEMLTDLNYGALLRFAGIHQKEFGSGLGVMAVAARVAHEMSAKNFELIEKKGIAELGQTYLAGTFSR